MKKWKKIILWTLGSLLALTITFILTINTIVCHILCTKVDNAIAKTDTVMIGYGEINVDVFTGRMWVKDVVFQTDKLPEDSFRAYSRMKIDMVKLEGVNYKSLLRNREIDLTGLLIDGVMYKGILDTKAMAAHKMADDVWEDQKRKFGIFLKEAQKHLKRVGLRRLAVKNAKVDMRALETGLSIKVQKMGTELHDLGYNLRDSIPFHLDNAKLHVYINDVNVRMPDSLMNISTSAIFTTPAVRGLVIADIKFATDTVYQEDKKYHSVSIDTVRLEHIGLPNPNKKRSFSVEKLRVVNCNYFGSIDEQAKREGKKKKKLEEINFDSLGFETKEAILIAKIQKKQDELMTEQKKEMLEAMQLWFNEILLNHIAFENINMHLKSYKTKLDLKAKNINFSFNDLGYSLIDTIPYHFDRNVYSIGIGKVDMTMPDGLIKLSCNSFEHKNCGPLCIGKTRIYNTTDKWRLAHIKGDVTSTWIDITLDTFFTSGFSPFATFYKGELQMESITAILGDMYMFTDNRNMTIKEFKMPSKKSLMEIKNMLHVGVIRVGVRKMKADITGIYANPGEITLRDAIVALRDTTFQEIEAEDLHIKIPDSDICMDIQQIHTSKEKKGLIVKDIAFRTSEEYVKGEQFHSIDIDSILLEGILLPDFKDKTDIAASCLRIVHPVYRAYIDEKSKKNMKHGKIVETEDEETLYGEDVMEKRKKAFKKAQLKNLKNVMQDWLDNAKIGQIKLDDADVDIHSIRSGFSLKTTDFALHMSGVGFNIDRYMPMNLKDTNMSFDPIRNNFKLLGNNVITNLTLRNLHTTLPDSSMFLNVKRVYTDHSTHSLIITGIRYATDTVIPLDEMYHDASIDSIRFDGIILPDLKEQKEASLSNLRIINACYYGQIDEKRKKAKKKETINGVEVEEELTEEEKKKIIKHERTMQMLNDLFKGASLDKISLENANAKVRSLSSNLDLDITGVNLELNDISYELENVKGLNFNDSIYCFGINHADIMLPDSSMVMEINNLRHSNCGPLTLGRTKMHNTVDKWEIAHTKGDVPTTWMSMVIDTVHTSDINPFKIAQTAGKIRLDTVTAVIDTMYIFRDIRYAPKKPYRMLHKPIMSAPAKIADMFSLNVADATINEMDIVLPKTDSCVMKMAMQDIHGLVYNVNTKPGNVITVEGDAHWGGGTAHLNMSIPLNERCPWDLSMTAKDIDMSCLNDLTYPIAALKIGGKIDELKTIISGDSANALGYLSLSYSGLDIKFHKGSPTPIKFIQKNPKFLTFLGRSFVTKSNPRHKGRMPLAYQAEWKNDVWKPSALFMIGPLIKGTIETMLPGLFVHKRVKQDKLIIKHNFKEQK